jgi:acyl dehydratase
MSTSIQIPETLSERLIVHGRGGLHGLVGREFVLDAWHVITQEAVDAYAAASGEPGALGRPGVPGFMTLGLTIKLFFDTFELRGFHAFVNYGVNRMRLPHPLLVGDRVRARVRFAEVRDGVLSVDATTQLTFERAGGEKPVCWVEWIGRGYEQRTQPGPGCAV